MTDDHDAGEPGSAGARARHAAHREPARPAACVHEDAASGGRDSGDDDARPGDGDDDGGRRPDLAARKASMCRFSQTRSMRGGSAAAPANFEASAYGRRHDLHAGEHRQAVGAQEDRSTPSIRGARARSAASWRARASLGRHVHAAAYRAACSRIARGISDWRIRSGFRIASTTSARSRATVSIVFKPFEPGGETKTVTLQPHNGVIRLHITNDPFAEDTPHGSREKSPCETLPHFCVVRSAARTRGNGGDPECSADRGRRRRRSSDDLRGQYVLLSVQRRMTRTARGSPLRF